MPDHAQHLLEFIDVAAVGNDLLLPRGADVQAPVRIILA
jgi:hypothetical protein